MPPKFLIFGTHPLLPSLLQQCGQENACCYPEFTVPELQSVPETVVILTNPERPGTIEDAAAQQFLLQLADSWKGRSPRAIPVHLLLQEAASLRMYQRMDFPESVNAVFEVWPFTLQEAWADQVIVRFPGLSDNPYPPLDREPVTPDSQQFIHLIIIGFDSYAAAIAIRAAQVAHFPNYSGKDAQPLRSRITVIHPEASRIRNDFTARYQHLFHHSFYRTVYPEKQQSELHHPAFEGQREDFVDVEWEFVEAQASHPVVSQRLSTWARDPKRQLTLVLSGADDAANMDVALSLPETLYQQKTPVWVRLRKDVLSPAIGQNPRLGNLIPFGMDHAGYNLRLPLASMSRLVHYLYSEVFSGKGCPTSFPEEEVELAWKTVGPYRNRLSNAGTVMTMATKLHSMGHDAADLNTFYALTAEEVEALTRTEHNRWSVERLLAGTRPCTEEERSAVKADIKLKKAYKKERDAHLDLCAYDELGVDEAGNDVRIYDRILTACIPLIVESYLKEGGR